MHRPLHGASLCSASFIRATLAEWAGTEIEGTCNVAHHLACLCNCDVLFEFNGVVVNMSAASDPQSVADEYHKKVQQHHNF